MLLRCRRPMEPSPVEVGLAPEVQAPLLLAALPLPAGRRLLAALGLLPPQRLLVVQLRTARTAGAPRSGRGIQAGWVQGGGATPTQPAGGRVLLPARRGRAAGTAQYVLMCSALRGGALQPLLPLRSLLAPALACLLRPVGVPDEIGLVPPAALGDVLLLQAATDGVHLGCGRGGGTARTRRARQQSSRFPLQQQHAPRLRAPLGSASEKNPRSIFCLPGGGTPRGGAPRGGGPGALAWHTTDMPCEVLNPSMATSGSRALNRTEHRSSCSHLAAEGRFRDQTTRGPRGGRLGTRTNHSWIKTRSV